MIKSLKDYGFYQLRSDQCVFSIWKDKNTFALVCLHTDDFIVMSNTKEYGDTVRADLLQMFPGKDLGKLVNFCGGVEIIHAPTGLKLSLRSYLTKIFNLFNIQPQKTTSPTISNSIICKTYEI